MGRGVFRNYYKGQNQGGGGREVGLAGVGWRYGEKIQTTVIEQQFFKKEKKKCDNF